ncbi:porin family protein [Hymenobacter artigasi]|uniref:Outer membrane protein beta-barrel domain-containing protein n=1 Tax=Hymenobacter artigasi TaxID=2719616 RepID=A0ABX1HLF6_9BACT|nr:porin family protein [Hymenobacter artigasi]NKI89766.1 hypothetical protein [Hymenobacter artigasi]
MDAGCAKPPHYARATLSDWLPNRTPSSHAIYQVKKQLLLAIFFSLLGLTSRAQNKEKDFVVKANGDTLRGTIRNSFYRPGREAARLQQGKTTLQFNPDEIAGYGRPYKQVLVSRQVGAKGAPEFVRPIALGYLSLYAGTNAENELRFYVQPADSAYLVEIAPQNAMLTLNRLMGDCPALDFGAEATRRRFPYSRRGMLDLVKTYNTCRQPAQPTRVMEPKGALVFRFGVKAGLHASRFNFGPESASPVNFKPSYQFGVTLNMQRRSRFSTQIELNYLSLKNEFEQAVISPSIITSSRAVTLALDYKQLQLPILLRYQLTNGPVRAFINAGPCAGFNFSNASTLKTKYVYLNDSQTSPYQLPESISAGFVAGAGLLFKIPTGHLLSLEARVDHLYDGLRKSYAAESDFQNPQHTSFRLDAGILF